MLLIALAPLPYGYYTFLRLVVTLGAALLSWLEFSGARRLTVWATIFGLVALLFNPLVPVHLYRDVWAILDITTAIVFARYWWSGRLA